MKRLISIITCLLLVFVSAQPSVAEEYRQGSSYMLLDKVQPTQSSDGRIEILEVFYYACPHCYELEPKLKSWLQQQKNVDFRRMPAILGPAWSELGKFYYTAEKLGLLEKLHDKFYESIHKDGRQYHNKGSIMQFFMNNGVSAFDFEEAYLSPEVIEKTSQARIMSVKYGLRGVPAIIVNGKYMTAPYLVSSQQEMLKVMDYLIGLESRQTTTGGR